MAKTSSRLFFCKTASARKIAAAVVLIGPVRFETNPGSFDFGTGLAILTIESRTVFNSAIRSASIKARTLSTLEGRSTARSVNVRRGSAYFFITSSRFFNSARRTAISSAVGPALCVLIGTGFALNGCFFKPSEGGAGRGRLGRMLNGRGTVTFRAFGFCPATRDPSSSTSTSSSSSSSSSPRAFLSSFPKPSTSRRNASIHKRASSFRSSSDPTRLATYASSYVKRHLSTTFSFSDPNDSSASNKNSRNGTANLAPLGCALSKAANAPKPSSSMRNSAKYAHTRVSSFSFRDVRDACFA
mmetsp:Transcript_13343/g.56856  ORF Transcript_13343/g.56856 Transcript_13343/m.56856 type:complete len:300 (+) Transcript_13343:1563-2462(+)